jgi:phage-related protein
MKRLVWLGDSLERIRAFPPEGKRRAGFQLERVQAGLEPTDWKPMPSIGLGVKELRVRAAGAFRVVFVAKFAEVVYVLHAFEKKSNKTAAVDVETARRRFRALVTERRP